MFALPVTSLLNDTSLSAEQREGWIGQRWCPGRNIKNGLEAKTGKEQERMVDQKKTMLFFYMIATLT